MIHWFDWLKRLKKILRIYNIIFQNYVRKQEQSEIWIDCWCLIFWHNNRYYIMRMSSSRIRHSCLSWTLWRQCLHEKRSCKDYSNFRWYIDNHKMICWMYYEWWNKITMKYSTNIFNWWFFEFVFDKRTSRKYYRMNHNKWYKHSNNDCKNHSTTKLHWLMLSRLEECNWYSIQNKIFMNCLILNVSWLRLYNWNWHILECLLRI